MAWAFLLLILYGCAGYTPLSADTPLVLEPERRQLFIKGVTNISLDPDLEPRLRSLVRDELTKRAQVIWVESKDATAYVYLNITKFSSAVTMKDADDRPLRSAVSITLNMQIRTPEGETLYSAGTSHSESFYTDQTDAEKRVIEFAVRKLVDNMSRNY